MKFPEIKNLCDFNNARACINLNRRSFEKIGFQMIRKVAEQVMNKDFRSVRKAYESVCGLHSAEPKDSRKWIIDIDETDFDKVQDLINKITIDINSYEPTEDKDKIICIIPTKNGIHLITRPFNKETFNLDNPNVDVHKDNPTILYCK